MAWIRTVDQETATGALKDEYTKVFDRAGRLFDVVQIMGLNPSHLRGSMDLHLSLMHGTSELTRAQREMMAVVVSIANRCHYRLSGTASINVANARTRPLPPSRAPR